MSTEQRLHRAGLRIAPATLHTGNRAWPHGRVITLAADRKKARRPAVTRSAA
ncbi:MAG: hypothetical protein K8S97_08515 [Anaerolineae bacterium]|nr:hypothetical protein [Anaerolineae bacterium]